MVRQYEHDKAKGILKPGDDGESTVKRATEDMELDELYLGFRRFLDDLNEKGQKREMKRLDKPNRTKFLENLEDRDFFKKGTLSDSLIRNALVHCKYDNLPS